MTLQHYDVFLSYESEMQVQAIELFEKLKMLDIEIWNDLSHGFERGFNHEKSIQALKNSRVFLCFATQLYFKDEDCLEKFNKAFTMNKPTVVLLFEKVSYDNMSYNNSIKIGYHHLQNQVWIEKNFNEIKSIVMNKLLMLNTNMPLLKNLVRGGKYPISRLYNDLESDSKRKVISIFLYFCILLFFSNNKINLKPLDLFDSAGFEDTTDFYVFSMVNKLKADDPKSSKIDQVNLCGCKYITIWSLHYLNKFRDGKNLFYVNDDQLKVRIIVKSCVLYSKYTSLFDC
jgi:hypothetical protein